MALCLTVTGCAHAGDAHRSLAKASLVMCKHCNCTMPAELPDEAPCPVCKCKLRVQQCRTGAR